MNKARRKRIDKILKDLEKLQTAIEALPDSDDIKSAIEEVADEEREYFDNMHENLQGGDKGQAAEQAADNLDEAKSAIEEIDLPDLAEKVSEAIANLETARDGG